MKRLLKLMSFFSNIWQKAIQQHHIFKETQNEPDRTEQNSNDFSQKSKC